MREPETEPEGASGSGQLKKVSNRRNVTTNYIVAVGIVVVGFVTTPILTHQLGILRYGVWALIGSLIPFLEILELGFANATVAFVSRHLELEDDDAVSEDPQHLVPVSSPCLGILAFATVVIFAIFLPDIITSIPKSLVGQAQFLLLLLALDMALSIPMDTFGGALTAMQRFDLLNYSLLGVVLAQAVGWVIVLVVFHGGLIALGVVTVAISIVGQVVRLVMVHHLLPWFRLSLRGFDRSDRADLHHHLGLVRNGADLRCRDRPVGRPRRRGGGRRAGRRRSTRSRSGWRCCPTGPSGRGSSSCSRRRVRWPPATGCRRCGG